MAARFAAFAAAERSTSDDDPASTLPSAWSACRAAWQEAARHDALLDLAVRLERLPQLARRYREVLDETPDDPIATRRLAQIGVLLETAARAQARGESSPRATRVLWLLCYLGAAALLVATVRAALLLIHRLG
jgi:hypothetical protein